MSRKKDLADRFAERPETITCRGYRSPKTPEAEGDPEEPGRRQAGRSELLALGVGLHLPTAAKGFRTSKSSFNFTPSWRKSSSSCLEYDHPFTCLLRDERANSRRTSVMTHASRGMMDRSNPAWEMRSV